MNVLLDTNVLAVGLVGGPLGYLSDPSQIWRSWTQDRFTLLLSDHLLDELRNTLELPWFTTRVSPSERSRLVQKVVTEATMVLVDAFVSGIAAHPEDDLVLAAAVSGNADFLVTRDKAFRAVGEYRGVRIRTPSEFLTELDATLGVT